jgi:hypothetical protein
VRELQHSKIDSSKMLGFLSSPQPTSYIGSEVQGIYGINGFFFLVPPHAVAWGLGGAEGECILRLTAEWVGKSQQIHQRTTINYLGNPNGRQKTYPKAKITKFSLLW